MPGGRSVPRAAMVVCLVAASACGRVVPSATVVATAPIAAPGEPTTDAAGAASAAVGAAVLVPGRSGLGVGGATAGDPATATTAAPATSTVAPTTVPPATTRPPAPTTTLPGNPAPPTGFLTFRGDATRSRGGVGPVPTAPRVLWRAPGHGMCAPSEEYGETKTWCGTGWVGQPVALERGGRTMVMFGAYDRGIHFLDAASGADVYAPIMTGDIAKGTATVDPDGYPLLYEGSRDNLLRVIAIDRPQPVVLYTIDAHKQGPTQWNDDWDGAPLVVRDHLVAGGENGRLHVVRLNRTIGPDGLVQVDPGKVWSTPGWDAELLRAIGDNRVSIEGSVAMVGTTVYFANSGGLMEGWDIGPLLDGTGEPTQTLRYWTGDDTDAAVVVGGPDELYVGVEWDRGTARAAQEGQFLRIDPTHPDAPVVWAVQDQHLTDGGTWSTAALWKDLVIWPSGRGRVLGIERATGTVRWEVPIGYKTLSSAVVVDGVWIQGDSAGRLRAFDVRDTTVPPRLLWEVRLPGNIESTPLVYEGRIYVGTRDGYFYALGDA